MGRKKKLTNDNVFYIEDNVPKLDYKKIGELIYEYNISYHDFCDLAHISTETMQRIKNNKEICVKTLLKIIDAFNKLNINKKHTLNDIITLKSN